MVKIFIDWWVIPLGFIGLIDLSKGYVLRCRNGMRFKIFHFMEALIITETCYNNDYKITSSRDKLTIIDIGANIGSFSIFAAMRNRNSKILAYEPATKTFKQLIENIQMNGFEDRIIAHKEAVDGKKRNLKLYDSGISGMRSIFRTRDEKKYEWVKAISLGDVFVNNKLKKCDFLKIDCEGAEYEILLNTSPKIFSKISKLSLEFHEIVPGANHEDLVKFLKKMGYSVRHNYHSIENTIGYIYASK